MYLIFMNYLSHPFKNVNLFRFIFASVYNTMSCKPLVKWKGPCVQNSLFKHIRLFLCNVTYKYTTEAHAQSTVAAISLSPLIFYNYLNSNVFAFSGYYDVFLHSKYISSYLPLYFPLLLLQRDNPPWCMFCRRI